jgi:hypothetical protein
VPADEWAERTSDAGAPAGRGRAAVAGKAKDAGGEKKARAGERPAEVGPGGPGGSGAASLSG